jgi:hypothetical protein
MVRDDLDVPDPGPLTDPEVEVEHRESASMPGAIVPLSPSSKEAYAPPRVQAVSASPTEIFCPGTQPAGGGRATSAA